MNSLGHIDISVVIPIYNAEAYLERCLLSVLSQSFASYEVILVDDGSTDSSLNICNAFASQDSRIRVLHQNNAGVSSARNLGIENAKAPWVAFVDSDDSVTKDYLSSLYSGVRERADSLIFQGLRYVNAAGNEIGKVIFEQKTYSKDEFSILSNNLEIYKFGFPFAKLYNRELLNKHNIRFNTAVSFSEDMLFMYQYLSHCNCVSMIEGGEYLYLVGDAGSLSTRLNNFESEYETYKQMKEILSLNGKSWGITPESELYKSVVRLLYRAILSCYYRKTYKLREKRIEILKMVADQHHDDICLYRSSLIYNKIIRFCLRLRAYRLLDVVLSQLIQK